MEEAKSLSASERDEILIEKIKEGDQDAFKKLYDKYKFQIFSLIQKMLRNSIYQEDALQEVFIRVYKYLNKFRKESALQTWLYKITLNVCRSFLKKDKKTVLLEDSKEMNFGIQEPDEDKILKEFIIKAVNSLPHKQKEVFILKHFDGLKISEISEIIGSKEGTVKAHLFRAIKNLQEKLKNYV